MRYTYAEQAKHYRDAARDRGCTCPDLMAPHTHLTDCPLWEMPGGVPSAFHDHAPAADVRPDSDGASRPASVPPDNLRGPGETTPGEESQAVTSPGAGERRLVTVHEAYNCWCGERHAFLEREEQHAEERHWEALD